MLFFFRLSQPLAIPFLFLYALLVNAVPLRNAITGPTMSVAESFAAGDQGVSIMWEFLSGSAASQPAQPNAGLHVVAVLAGILLVFGQALLVNRSLRTIKGLGSAGYLPALFYLFFAAAFGAGFNAPTVGAGFLLLSFNRLVRAYGPDPADALLLEAGFWVGIAAATVNAYAAFLPFALLMASNLRPINVRETLVVFAGFASVFILVFSGIYVLDYGPEWLSQSWKLSLEIPQISAFTASSFLQTIIPGIIGVGGIFTASQRNSKSLIQVRKLNTWTTVFALFAVLVWVSGVVIAPAAIFPLAFFTAYWIQAGGWPKTWEAVHLTMVSLLIAGQLIAI